MRVVGGERHQLRREDGGERMLVLGPIHAQHRFDAGEGRGLRGDGRGVRAQQDYGDFSRPECRSAQVTHFAVAGFRVFPSCSPTMSILCIRSNPSS